MRRAFVLPVSAAVVGALLAIGVSALDRAHSPLIVDRFDHDVFEAVEVDLTEVDAQIAEAMERVERIELETELRLEREVLREVRQKLRTELRSAAEAEELTAAQQEELREAMEQLAEQLPMMMGLPEIVDGLSKDDGSAHKKDGGTR